MAIRQRRFPIMRESREILTYLLGNEGNIGNTRLDQEMTEPGAEVSGPPSTPNMPWRPWWLLVTRAVLGSARRDDRRRVVRMLKGTALVTVTEQRRIHANLKALLNKTWEEWKVAARGLRLEYHERIKEKGGMVRGTADFEETMTSFLEENYTLTKRMYSGQLSGSALDQKRRQVIGLWYHLGLGRYTLEWPAY